MVEPTRLTIIRCGGGGSVDAEVAGNWPVNARPVLEKVSHAFVIFYFLYITIIVFAVIRVISAIFLKDTLDEAHNDAQQMADYVQRLEGLFSTKVAELASGSSPELLTAARTIDDSGQGMITEPRLQEFLGQDMPGPAIPG
eukprot:Skav210556  [mRNA]  locus=scaffold2699:110328:117314:- [translate_table: standard]